MNTARKGNAADLRVARYLEERGWLVGWRRHAKGGGDLVAYKPGFKVRLIEVKATLRPWDHFRPAERRELTKAAAKFDADALLALSPGKTVSLVPERDWPS